MACIKCHGDHTQVTDEAVLWRKDLSFVIGRKYLLEGQSGVWHRKDLLDPGSGRTWRSTLILTRWLNFQRVKMELLSRYRRWMWAQSLSLPGSWAALSITLEQPMSYGLFLLDSFPLSPISSFAIWVLIKKLLQILFLSFINLIIKKPCR